MRTKHMGCMTVLVCLLLTLSTTLVAQTPNEPTEIRTKAGPWGLLFQVKSSLSLAPLQGSRFSVQRDLAGGDAVRFGIGIYGSSNDATGWAGKNADKTDLSFSVDYVRYESRERDVSLFLGAGPAVGFTTSSNMEFGKTTEDTVVTLYEWKSEGDSWYMGLHMLLGAEWLLTHHIALTGEYSSSAVYSRAESDMSSRHRVGDGEWETTPADHVENAGWSFGEMQVKLGLTIYL